MHKVFIYPNISNTLFLKKGLLRKQHKLEQDGPFAYTRLHNLSFNNIVWL